jgi:hypothetical protein
MLLTLLSPSGPPPTNTIVWLRVGGVWKGHGVAARFRSLEDD